MKVYELFDPADGVTRRVVSLKWLARLITRINLYRNPRGNHKPLCWDYQEVDR